MSYTRTLWRDGAAPAIDAAHLNNIEEGIVALEAAIASMTKPVFKSTAEINEETGTISIDPTISNGSIAKVYQQEANIAKTGYKPIGLLGISISNTSCELRSFALDPVNQKVTYSLYMPANANTTIRCSVMYMAE